MRGAAIFLFLAAAAGADPFDLKRDEVQIDDAAYARYVETLAILREAAVGDPAGSLERAVDLVERFGLADRFEDAAAKALAGAAEEGPKRGTLLSLYGHLLVARGSQDGNVWIFQNNRMERGEMSAETRKILTTASGALDEAIRLRPKDARAREDLATALEMLDPEKNAEEALRLRTEAGALRLAGMTPPPEPPPDESERLRRSAEELEQKATEPDHGGALLLRKQALVVDFCSRTIPFEYDPALYGPVSLLASEDLVVRNLTRTYRKRDGTVDSVAPKYHAAKPSQRVQLALGLGRDPGGAAGAALLKILATAWQRDDVTEAAMKALVAGKHEAVRRHLGAMLAAVVYGGMPLETADGGFLLFEMDGPSPAAGVGEALLVEAATALRLEEAAPVLARLLAKEDDLIQPRGIARALGELGRAEHADALLAVARDPLRDVYFRREAILALGRIAPARLAEVPKEPTLELALAAAQYRAEPSEALKGRLLQGLERPHEADDAARYLADLGVREAIPDLERRLDSAPDHYAAPALRDALSKLRVRG